MIPVRATNEDRVGEILFHLDAKLRQNFKGKSHESDWTDPDLLDGDGESSVGVEVVSELL